MATIAGVTQGPPVSYGNAAGHALIGEIVRFPAGTAADTLAFVSKYLEEIVAVIGNVSFTAPVKSADGATTTMKIADTVPASEFMDVLVLGFARRVHSGGQA
jgi:hypothetical protein